MVQAATESVRPPFPEAVYAELRAIAATLLDRETPGHTLQPTALVHEAYLRLVCQRGLSDAPRERLLAIGAMMIRRVLLDHYRHKAALKRGGGAGRAEPDRTPAEERIDVLVVEDALAKLERFDPDKARLVEMKFYGGMSVEQIATLRDESPRKVARDWAFARAWLGRELSA